TPSCEAKSEATSLVSCSGERPALQLKSHVPGAQARRRGLGLGPGRDLLGRETSPAAFVPTYFFIPDPFSGERARPLPVRYRVRLPKVLACPQRRSHFGTNSLEAGKGDIQLTDSRLARRQVRESNLVIALSVAQPKPLLPLRNGGTRLQGAAGGAAAQRRNERRR